jgi:hypothetical protein
MVQVKWAEADHRTLTVGQNPTELPQKPHDFPEIRAVQGFYHLLASTSLAREQTEGETGVRKKEEQTK